MNRQDFLNTVRLSINNKSADTLKKLVLAFARMIPRSDVEEALSLLEKSEVILAENTPVDLTAAVKQLCLRVVGGDYDLSWEYDGHYYDNYYDEDETLSDKDGLGEEIQELLETAITYVKAKRYAEAFTAFDALYTLSIPMKDYDDIDIETLFSQSILNLDETDTWRHYAYSAVMTLRGSERIQKLHEIVVFSHHSLKMQEVMDVGVEDMPERKDFEEEWIAFWLANSMVRYEHVLLDAILFSGGIRALHDFTLENGARYQSAYIRLTEMYIDQKDYEQAVLVVRDGFEKLTCLNRTRMLLADLLLTVGNTTEDQNLITQAIWEGFASSSDLQHFLTICLAGDENVKDRAMAYINSIRHHLIDHHYIRFLYGDYASVYTACAKDKELLGWSMSDKGKMVPLFLALLAGGDTLSPCVKTLIGDHFPFSHIKDVFYRVLVKSYRYLPDDEWKKYCHWCLKEIDGRVAAIVGGLHRGSYKKASALIVAMAEVLRAAGDENGAAQYIIGYKEQFPRHTAFRNCLKSDIASAKFGKLF